MDVEEKIIELVREHSVLYDTTNKHYCNQNVKVKIWATIANQCELASGEEAKKVWTKLRDGFRHSLKRSQRKSGDPGSAMTKWKYESQMSFLKSYMKDRPRHTNNDSSINSASEPEYELVQNTDSVNRLLAEDDWDDGSSDEIYVNPKKPRKENVPSYMTLLLKQREERQRQRDEWRHSVTQQDELKLFFDSMYGACKRLSPGLQRSVKRKLFAIISEAEDLMDQQSGTTAADNLLYLDNAETTTSS